MLERQPSIGVAISTVGRVEGLDKLFASLERQTLTPAHVVVADQSKGQQVAKLVERWSSRLPVSRVESPSIGLSRGRNAAVGALNDVELVTFPDDDCWYDAHTLELAAARLWNGPWQGITGRLVSAYGERITFGSEQRTLDMRTVWTHAIEATMFLKRDAMDAVGTFDEDLGIGARTPWQSGEGTDYLLRLLKNGMQIEFLPEIQVHEDGALISPAEELRKVRAYARGTGRVHRLHYGPWEQLKVVGRPTAAAALRFMQGRPQEARRYASAAVGRAEGILLPPRTPRLPSSR